MRHHFILIFAVLRLINAKSSTVGRDFYFGILTFANSCCHDGRNIITVDVTNVSPQDVRIRLQIPYFHNDTFYIIQKGQRQTIQIPPSIQEDIPLISKSDRGIRISSDNDVSVIVTNNFAPEIFMDVYNILPTTSLRKGYSVLSYRGDGFSVRGSSFLVTAVYNNTNLTYNINNTMHTVLLDALDVFQYVCPLYCDLSGTKVIADKNISVTAGSGLTENFVVGQDYLASEMIPTSAWTTSNIVPPLLPQLGYIVRIVSEHNSLIKISNTTHSFSSQPDLRDLYFENLPLLVTSSEAFSIAQYGVRYNDTIGDIFEAVVPGIDQYMNEYIFTVPHAFYGNTKHFIAMIIPRYQMNSTILDGQSVQSHNLSKGDIKQLDVPYPFDNYTVLTFETNEGVHHFWHPQRDVQFGVLVYGLGEHLGYGFYAGYDLEGTSKTEATPTTERSNAKITTKTFVATSVTAMPSKLEEHMCFNCTDQSHPGLCDTVQKCANNEICYVESYTVSGQRKYRSGCKELGVCEADHAKGVLSGSFCFDCCHTSYCNNQGCGEVIIPDRNARGPMCFHCDHIARPEECSKVEPCGLYEACIIEAYTWFGETLHYKMGCDQNLCDTPLRVMDTSHAVKRATQVCSHCCHDDFCNRNCTKASDVNAGPAIIG